MANRYGKKAQQKVEKVMHERKCKHHLAAEAGVGLRHQRGTLANQRKRRLIVKHFRGQRGKRPDEIRHERKHVEILPSSLGEQPVDGRFIEIDCND